MTPLVLITGFLGAGKTTLLRTLLPRLERLGIRPHVILNDYENADVDASTFEGYLELVRPIAGTCICCGSQEELMQELRGAQLKPNSVMLLEANGTADTTEVIEILTADRRVRGYTLPIQVTVVDASRWQKRGRNDGLERVQGLTASYHVLSRSDEVTSERRRNVVRSLRMLAPGSRTVDTDELATIIASVRSSADALPPRRFGQSTHSTARSAASQSSSGRDHHATHHFASMEIPFPDPVESVHFRTLLEGLPEEVLRVKGIARLIGVDHPVYFERTNGAESVRFTPIRQGGGFDYVAILIGSNLQQTELSNAFADLQRRRIP